jgi:hypothetical protein
MLKVGRSLAAPQPCPGGTRNPNPRGGELDASAELGSPAARSCIPAPSSLTYGLIALDIAPGPGRSSKPSGPDFDLEY